MAMTEQQMIEKLRSTEPGSILFVSYEAGREPTDRAILESERAVLKEGLARRHYVGELKAMWTTKRGDTVLTIMAYNRDRVSGGKLVEGGYRTFNPSLGQLLSVEVIEAPGAAR